MTGQKRAAIAFLVLLAALALFQLALIFGAPIGFLAWGGQQTVLDATLRVSSAISLAIYAVFAAIILDRSGLRPLLRSEKPGRIAAWVLVAYMVAGVGLNLLSSSPPERVVMSIVAACLAALGFIVARGPRREPKP